MTNEQIRERCTEFVLKECKGRWPAISIMESLYREAMAAGLEMAACSCDSEQIVDDERAYHAGEFAKWCRSEAQRVKECP